MNYDKNYIQTKRKGVNKTISINKLPEGVLTDYETRNNAILSLLNLEEDEEIRAKNKQCFVSDTSDNKKVTIIDAIMGSGKSTYVINEIINKHPFRKFLCVLPTLEECSRYKNNINAYIFEPKARGTKTLDLQRLISKGKNIVTTHALIQNIDSLTIDLLKKSNYTLIIDECLDVVHQYENNFKSSDIETIFNNNYVFADDKGFLIWNEDKYKNYDGRYNDIKRLCKLHSLMCLKKKDGSLSNKIFMWSFPTDFFLLFKQCYICTYLWNGSIQKAYFELHKIKYTHMTLIDGKLEIYDYCKELSSRLKYQQLINVYIGNLNNIGIPDRNCKNPLTFTWYVTKSRNKRGKTYLDILKYNTSNYFKNVIKSSSGDNMYTTFKEYQKYVKNDGYKKCFVSCNAKATNNYKHKKNLAYLINKFPPTNIVHFFTSYNIVINQDLYALSELLQWIWRSQIRENKPINLYMPSSRMRELLGKWILGKI